MKIYCAERGKGKTTKAIKLSIKYQMPIICVNNHHRIYIKQRAKKMGILSKLPEPLLKEEVRKKIIGSRVVGLIIDDLDDFLRTILEANVYYATSEDCEIERIDNYE